MDDDFPGQLGRAIEWRSEETVQGPRRSDIPLTVGTGVSGYRGRGAGSVWRRGGAERSLVAAAPR